MYFYPEFASEKAPMTFPIRKYPPEVTRQKMIAWCNKAERCQWDVRNKLMNWHIPSAERENLIAELIGLNLLNEKRFAEALAHDKSAFLRWGTQKIAQQLKLKGISERNIQDALKTIDSNSTRESILHLIKKKEPQYKGLQLYQKKYKLTRFLLSKGYEIELIHELVENYYN